MMIKICAFLLFITARVFTQDAQELLRRSDEFRNGWDSFVVHTRITKYKDNREDAVGHFEVMINGPEKTLVRFLNADQKGQFLLLRAENMWLYLPNTRRPIRVTPLQRLMGDASNGDIARTGFAQDYAASFIREESVEGRDCTVLELTARSAAATYQRVEYWVAKQDLEPVKAELYLTSGKHYKSVTYDAFAYVDGQRVLSRMTLYDRLRENRFTVMEFSGYEPRDWPDKYFNKNYLTQLK